MSNDISGFGTRIQLVASVSFPQGITLTEFADDADPLDMPSMAYAEVANGLNGDMVAWSKANPLKTTINLIPDGNDDRLMAALAEANRVAKGKNPARDVITMTIIYPDGRSVNLSRGRFTDGMPFSSIASAGRKKSKPYGFAFENMVRT